MQENKKKARETNELNNGTKIRRRIRAQTNLQRHENKTMQLAKEERNKRTHKKRKKRKKV